MTIKMEIKWLAMCSVALYFATNCLLLALLVNASKACSCILSHPQEHYCSADFVAVIQIKRAAKLSKFDGRTLSYFIKVKKEFKLTPKAKIALSHGLIWSPNPDNFPGSCGRRLKAHTRYLIAGTVNGEKAWISLCNFVQEVSTLTAKQLKGFRKLYLMGCNCKVRQISSYPLTKMMGKTHLNFKRRSGYCNWETKWDGDNDCQALTSVCVPTAKYSQECRWLSSNSYKACMKRRNEIEINKSELLNEDGSRDHHINQP